MPCSLLKFYGIFWGVSCFHLHDRKQSHVSKQKVMLRADVLTPFSGSRNEPRKRIIILPLRSLGDLWKYFVIIGREYKVNNVLAQVTLSPWRGEQYVPPKHWWTSTTLHGITSLKTVFSVSAVRTSNHTIIVAFWSEWKMCSSVQCNGSQNLWYVILKVIHKFT
jgi:hypothetical protein